MNNSIVKFEWYFQMYPVSVQSIMTVPQLSRTKDQRRQRGPYKGTEREENPHGLLGSNSLPIHSRRTLKIHVDVALIFKY